MPQRKRGAVAAASGFVELRPDSSFPAAGRCFVPVGDATLVAFVLPQVAAGRPARLRIVGRTPTVRTCGLPRAPYEKASYLAAQSGLRRRALATRGSIAICSCRPRRVPRQRGAKLRRDLMAARWCRLPQLAIHLEREVNEKALVLNRQNTWRRSWVLREPARQDGRTARRTRSGAVPWLCAQALGIEEGTSSPPAHAA